VKFGIVLPIQAAGVTPAELLDELRAEVRAADRAGFDAFFLPEFHSVRGTGGLISPAVLGAALAEGTERIRVGLSSLRHCITRFASPRTWSC
jgi:alkanesulfonate monooxygenase SsuD/methylene tetrahydromethanopterin reductase-like flavin-dependent oxidoreductase (luciferase family)